MFSDGDSFRMVEVKSCKSNDEDLRRGIYQCVKYREVKKSEHLPYEIDVQSILVTERELNSGLKERARILGIKHKCVFVNKKQMKNTKKFATWILSIIIFCGKYKKRQKMPV
jgi:hypothetical protein